MRKVPLTRPAVTDEMVEAVSNALRNERLVLGESVFKFEDAFAKYVGTDYAISVSSGTDALILALMVVGVRGREVVTTPLSFIATANAVVHAGGTPIFADASEGDYNIDPGQMPILASGRTAALLPVHLFGHPAPMDELMEIADKNHLPVIEDAAQAHGAVFRGKRVGSIGDLGCFSFYSTKNMTVGGEGGMITTSDKKLADNLRKLRDCGRVSRYVHDVFGFTARLNTCNAAFGLVQLKHLEEWNERRRSLAGKYRDKLGDLPQIVLPPMGNKDVIPVFHLYAIRVEQRDEMAKFLESRGIECAIHYPVPIHLQPVYRDAFGFAPGQYPVSEKLSHQLLSLPMYPGLSEDDINYVCEQIAEFFRRQPQ